jgi:hypothetical protein
VNISLPEFSPDKIKSKYAFVIKLNHTGAFAARPKVKVEYPDKSFKPVVTISAEPGVEARYTLNGSTPTENSTLYTKPFSPAKSTTLLVLGFKKELLPGNIVSTQVKVFEWHKSIKANKPQAGLQVSAYKIESPASVDDLNNIKADRISVATGISIRDIIRKENAGLIYEGFIKVPANAVYHFYLSSDDGSKLWIDDDMVVDNDGLHGDEAKEGLAALQSGYHKIKLSYIQGTGEASLQLLYGVKENEEKPIQAFFH